MGSQRRAEDDAPGRPGETAEIVMVERSGSMLSRRQAERVHFALAEVTEMLDDIASDLDPLGHSGDPVHMSDAEVGRLFLLARGAASTATQLASYARQILDRAEARHYWANESLTEVEYRAYAERRAAWRPEHRVDTAGPPYAS